MSIYCAALTYNINHDRGIQLKRVLLEKDRQRIELWSREFGQRGRPSGLMKKSNQALAAGAFVFVLLVPGAAAAPEVQQLAEELLDGTIVSPGGVFESWR